MALLNKNSPYPAILAACFGVFIAADDQTVIVTILPSIMSDFRLGIDDLGQVSWTVTGYLLGYTAVLPLMGRISDVHGHRRVYLLAMGIFLVGSVLAAMADGLWTLVGFRVIQAVGGGAVDHQGSSGASLLHAAWNCFTDGSVAMVETVPRVA